MEDLLGDSFSLDMPYMKSCHFPIVFAYDYYYCKLINFPFIKSDIYFLFLYDYFFKQTVLLPPHLTRRKLSKKANRSGH